MPLLTVTDLRTTFHSRTGVFRAVDGVSFTLQRGEILGIVGESGSGKSVTCHSLLGLVPCPPGRIEGGSAMLSSDYKRLDIGASATAATDSALEPIDLLCAPSSVLRTIRGKRISMIFQDPMTSLNPYMRIGEQIIEPLLIHENISRADALKRAETMLGEVGIDDAPRRLRQYPHEFSGGMRQRVMIAMALITNPDLLIADEPTTALDVTVQAQILELIKKLQAQLGMAVIFITHDLSVVSSFCQRVLVMYNGRIVEEASVRELFSHPQHPYTRALLNSIPALQPKGVRLRTIQDSLNPSTDDARL